MMGRFMIILIDFVYMGVLFLGYFPEKKSDFLLI